MNRTPRVFEQRGVETSVHECVGAGRRLGSARTGSAVPAQGARPGFSHVQHQVRHATVTSVIRAVTPGPVMGGRT